MKIRDREHTFLAIAVVEKYESNALRILLGAPFENIHQGARNRPCSLRHHTRPITFRSDSFRVDAEATITSSRHSSITVQEINLTSHMRARTSQQLARKAVKEVTEA